MKRLSLGLLLCATTAAAEPPAQLQADLGLSVIAFGYEHPVGDHLAVMLGAGVFGTYFLPWFDLGDNVTGGVADLRLTAFWSGDHHGLYITPYARAGYAGGDDEDTKVSGSGPVFTTGLFVGYAFPLVSRLDLRLGGGLQYIYVGGDHDVGASTPFLALDATLGLRL